jgi:transposase
VEIDVKREEIDAAIEKLVLDNEQLSRRFEILLSIPGVSKITAFALLIEMPELGNLEGKQAASLAGLAPVQRQSGSWKGHAYIRGGRAFLRQGPLYAGARRLQVQQRQSSALSKARRGRKNRQGRHNRRHAQARRPRQRPLAQ